VLRRSIGVCQTGVNAAGETVPLAMPDRFSAYTKGTCREDEPESRMKWSYLNRLFGTFAKDAPKDPLTAPPVPPSTPAPAPAAPQKLVVPPAPPAALAKQEHLANHRSP